MNKVINNYSIVLLAFAAVLVLGSCQMPTETSVPKYKPTTEEVREVLSEQESSVDYAAAISDATAAITRDMTAKQSLTATSLSGSGTVTGASWSYSVSTSTSGVSTTSINKWTITTTKSFPLSNGYAIAAGTKFTMDMTATYNTSGVSGSIDMVNSINLTGGKIDTISFRLKTDLSALGETSSNLTPTEIVVNGHVFAYADVAPAQ